METKHTPDLKLPFKVQDGGYIANSENVIIARPYGVNHIARAEFIVKACNCHDELVKALQDALKNMQSEPVECRGDWQRGMFCGLEDGGTNDIYEACLFGYERALGKVEEWVLCGFEELILKATGE